MVQLHLPIVSLCKLRLADFSETQSVSFIRRPLRLSNTTAVRTPSWRGLEINDGLCHTKAITYRHLITHSDDEDPALETITKEHHFVFKVAPTHHVQPAYCNRGIRTTLTAITFVFLFFLIKARFSVAPHTLHDHLKISRAYSHVYYEQ